MYISISKYSPELHKSEWESFIKKAKNSTFLQSHDFISYHGNSFHDHSLLLHGEKDKLIACFSANEDEEGRIWSHEGLTYGGVMVSAECKLPTYIEIFKAILKYYENRGVHEIF